MSKGSARDGDWDEHLSFHEVKPNSAADLQATINAYYKTKDIEVPAGLFDLGAAALTLPELVAGDQAKIIGRGLNTIIRGSGPVLFQVTPHTSASGTADAGGDTTHTVDAERTEIADAWNGYSIKYLTGDNATLVRGITDFDAVTDTIIHYAFPNTCDAGDTYIIFRNVQGDDWCQAILKDLHFEHNAPSATAIALDLDGLNVDLRGSIRVEQTNGTRRGTGIRAGVFNNAGMVNWNGSIEALDFGINYDISCDHLTAHGLNSIRPATYAYFIHHLSYLDLSHLFVLHQAATSADAFMFDSIFSHSELRNLMVEGVSGGNIFHYDNQNRVVTIKGFSRTTVGDTVKEAGTTWGLHIDQEKFSWSYGSATGNGAEQTIAHNLYAAPTRVEFWDVEGNDRANAYQSSVADGTNIFVTATNLKDYLWKARIW